MKKVFRLSAFLLIVLLLLSFATGCKSETDIKKASEHKTYKEFPGYQTIDAELDGILQDADIVLTYTAECLNKCKKSTYEEFLNYYQANDMSPYINHIQEVTSYSGKDILSAIENGTSEIMDMKLQIKIAIAQFNKNIKGIDLANAYSKINSYYTSLQKDGLNNFKTYIDDLRSYMDKGGYLDNSIPLPEDPNL